VLVRSDAVIIQDILENKSEKPVRTTSENIESELADYFHITQTYFAIRLPGGLNTKQQQQQIRIRDPDLKSGSEYR
jgi:hypothetical protein